MSTVILDKLSKVYKNGRGVYNLSLTIEKGQVYGLLGPNGSGKTTVMKVLTGLIYPTDGTVTVFGANPVTEVEKVMSSVGCLIESPNFYPYLTATENLEIVRKLYPGSSPAQTKDVLNHVGLAPYANEKTKKFSFGMKQRLGLAMALLSEPELLILDEPSNGLDIEGMADIRQIIKEQAQKGKTILLSSHLAGELEQICTDVAIIRAGKLLDVAKVPKLLNQYGNLENYYLTLIGNNREVAS